MRRRVAGVSNPWVLLAVLGLVVVLLAAMLFWWARRNEPAQSKTTLTIYCAAGMRVPLEKVAAAYKQEYGVETEIQYGGSNTLLSQLEVNKSGPADLYLAADEFYTQLAIDKGLAAETMPIATMQPVIAVPKGNPKNIKAISDLLREDTRVAIANPDQAAIGRAVREALSAAGSWEALAAHVTSRGVFKPTVIDVANDVKLGSVDAGLVWDSTAAMPQYREVLDVIAVSEFANAIQTVTVTVLKASPSPTAALRFARYLTARDRGLPAFAEFGFKPIDGDVWSWHPEITFFCGAVNRRAVEDIIAAFEQREGVKINTNYNGCGILTGQMRTIKQEPGGAGFPDVYMACDRYYLDNVAEWFQEDADVSDTDIVIAVPKGNPKNVRTLADLAASGVRVSVGQPEQCTIGALTRILLEREGLYDPVMRNVVMQTATSAMLVPTVTTSSVDASLAYITDTKAEADKVDVIRIESPRAKAIQPFSIARISDHKYLGRRLFQTIIQSRDKFESAGFHFRYDAGAKQVDKRDGA